MESGHGNCKFAVLLYCIILSTSGVFAQNNDTIYFYRNGALDYRAAVKDIGNVTFVEDLTVPSVTTKPIFDITIDGFKAGGVVVNPGGATITKAGICWSSTASVPGISESLEIAQMSNNEFNIVVAGLNSFTTYYVRAFVTLNTGTVVYGNTLTFKTIWDERCGALMEGGIWKEWMCHNLGADQSADPFEPSWRLNGNYYKWGLSTLSVSGPTGPGASEANALAIAGWTFSYFPSSNSWRSDVKGINDPCPSGYKVPNKTEWEELYQNNPLVKVGTWNESPTNYNAGGKFGEKLYLPMAGFRKFSDGSLITRGSKASYWSSTVIDSEMACFFTFQRRYGTSQNQISIMQTQMNEGFTVRCISDGTPVVETLTPASVTATSAASGGEVVSSGGSPVLSRGVCWNLTGKPTTADNKTSNGTNTGVFNSNITGLEFDKDYFIRAYATNANGTSYGVEHAIRTRNDLCGANVASGVWKELMCHNLGSSAVADPFLPDWKLNGGYYQWGRKMVSVNGPSGQAANQTNDAAMPLTWNTSYAPVLSWKDDVKAANDPCPYGFRIPTKLQWQGIIENNVKSNKGTWQNSPTNYSSGNMFGDKLFLPATGYRTESNGALADRGLLGAYWSSTINPTSTNAWSLNVSNMKNELVSIDRQRGLSVRCIRMDLSLAVVSTAPVTEITETSAFCGGNVVSDGYAEVSQRGVCWHFNPNPTIDKYKTYSGTGKGAFTGILTNLTRNQKYYVRAFAINSEGISYGEEFEFSTKTRIPIVQTHSAKEIKGDNLITGGVIYNDWQTSIIERGVCWSTQNAEPTIADSKKVSDLNLVDYFIKIWDLTPGTQYYFRAYATNIAGTGYGPTIIAKTNWRQYCGAVTSPGVWREFKCHNLGADTTANAFTPNWRLNGDYYRWGRKEVAAIGPSSPDMNGSNSGAIIDWYRYPDPNRNVWLRQDDPCPTGFRVPTKNEWQGVIDNNIYSVVGNWQPSYTNYSSGAKFGEKLYLPAAGLRYWEDGSLLSKNQLGYYHSRDFFQGYWNSERNEWEYFGGYMLQFFGLPTRKINMQTYNSGLPIRCIAE